MKMSDEASILPLVVSVAILIFSNWQPDDAAESASRYVTDRRALAIESQRALDDMRGTVRDLRARLKLTSPAQRSAHELELEGIEALIQKTQKQLLLFGAQDAASRRLIEQSFPDANTLEVSRWKSAG